MVLKFFIHFHSDELCIPIPSEINQDKDTKKTIAHLLLKITLFHETTIKFSDYRF